MKKIFAPPLVFFFLFFLFFLFSRGDASEAGTISYEAWKRVADDSLSAGLNEVEHKLGVAALRGFDDFLSVETAVFEIDEGGSRYRPYLGVVYVDGGLAVGFSTHYRSTSRGMLTRFELAHFDTLLHDSDLSAIAGASRDCAEFGVFTVGTSENVRYRLDAETYRKMEKLGALPSLPPDHGRKGYAA